MSCVSPSILPSSMRSTRLAQAAMAGIMGDDDDSIAGTVDVVEEREDLLTGGGVEITGRLVGEQQARTGHERPSDGDALPLAAREFAGPMPGTGP